MAVPQSIYNAPYASLNPTLSVLDPGADLPENIIIREQKHVEIFVRIVELHRLITI